MKPKEFLIYLTTSVFFFLLSINGYAQNVENVSKGSTIKRVNQNYKYQPGGFSEKVLKFSEQVFLNCPEYRTAEFLVMYEKEIERVQVLEATPEQLNRYPLLSTLSLRNKCNMSLTYDRSLTNSEDFNPLKYFFDYNSTEDQYYQIEHSNYIVKVSAIK